MIPQHHTDDKYPEALKHVRASKTGISIAMLQRRLDIGYGRAERLMWALRDNGVVTVAQTANGSVYKLVK